MVKKFTLSMMLLLASASAGEKRPLESSYQRQLNPMIKSYKKRNPVVTDERHCSSFVEVQGAHPKVGAGACKALCFFQDDQNEWCWQTTSPALSIGWTWAQKSSSTPNYFEIGIRPYVQSQVNIKYWLQIIRLF